MFEAPPHRYRVPFDGRFQISTAPTQPEPAAERGDDERKIKKANKKRLAGLVDRLDDLQRVLYADNRHALLLVFQAMDAAGKDSTIRAVMSGVNPAGCQVSSFKVPSSEELDHDFLWRSARRLPERGRIGVFNRSYYEEVLVVRVHPEYLEGQNLPRCIVPETIWEQRYQSIRDHELHLARNGTVVLKFFLNVSHAEQRKRFLARLDEPDKNWKFAAGDVRERGYWQDYQLAYQKALAATSRSWAPWFAIPADDKPTMRADVAEIVVAALERLDLRYPQPDPEEQARFDALRATLVSEPPLGD